MHQNEFIDFLQYEKRVSPYTIIAYKHDLQSFQGYCEKEFQIGMIEVNYQMIRSWIVSLMESGLTAKSVNRKISTLKSFYKFLVRKMVIKINPLTRVLSPKMPKRLPSFVEENKMTMLFDEIQFKDDFNGLRDQLILELFYATGIRLSELIGLKIKNCNGQTIKVLGKGNKERILPLTPKVLVLIERYKSLKSALPSVNETDNLLVLENGKKLYPKFVYNKVNHYLSQVTSMTKKSPHIIRHTFATHLLNNGADINAIKTLLGHSSLAATQVYTHNSIDKLRSIYINAHPLAG